MISLDEIKKLGLLSRIKITGHEAQEFQKGLDSILGYVSKLQKAPVDVRQGPSFLKSSRTVLNGVPENFNVFRKDEPIKDESEVKKGEHIRVKRIL